MLRRCTDHLTENAEHQAVAVLGIALTNIGTYFECGGCCLCVYLCVFVSSMFALFLRWF